MSDVSGGPGWWKASDGKWYPPQPPVSQPTEPPPTVPQQFPQPTGQQATEDWSGPNGVTSQTPTPESKPWYKHPVTIILSLFFCGPVGLVLVWISDWKRSTKIIVTAIIAAVTVALGIGAALSGDTTTDSQGSSTSLKGTTTTSVSSTTTPTTATTTTTTTTSTTTTTLAPVTPAIAPAADKFLNCESWTPNSATVAGWWECSEAGGEKAYYTESRDVLGAVAQGTASGIYNLYGSVFYRTADGGVLLVGEGFDQFYTTPLRGIGLEVIDTDCLTPEQLAGPLC